VPSYKVLAHNLNHDIAKSQADEIQRQKVEGERVTLVGHVINASAFRLEINPMTLPYRAFRQGRGATSARLWTRVM
jgi:hypothetical protein